MTDNDIVLVTGGSGLLGHAVHKRLETVGQQTLAIDLFPSKVEGLPVLGCDLTDVHRLHSLAGQHSIRSVVHCGAVSGPMLGLENPYSIVQANILGTANILELARIHKVQRVVFCSSASAYGPTPPGPVTEETPLQPSTVYGASKVAGEQLVSSYATQYGVEGVSLRLSWVYGPRRKTQCLIRQMLVDALEGCPTRLPWGADFYRQYLFVEDAVESLLLALKAPAIKRQSYLVSGGTYLTIQEVAEIVRSVVPTADLEVENGPDPIDDVQGKLDISAVERDLGYHPKYSLEEGIRTYLAWLKVELGYQGMATPEAVVN